MISEHNEIEAKLDAQEVSKEAFNKAVYNTFEVVEYVQASGEDYYYTSGDNVLRHRVDKDESGRHELTVKQRKSATSIRDRVEIDLHFAEKTKPEDVDALLRAVGFTQAFSIYKEARIFRVAISKKLQLTVVLYDVWKNNELTKRRFLEVEAEKGSQVEPRTAKQYVTATVALLRTQLSLGAPLNESLYEIYSGKTYKVA